MREMRVCKGGREGGRGEGAKLVKRGMEKDEERRKGGRGSERKCRG